MKRSEALNFDYCAHFNLPQHIQVHAARSPDARVNLSCSLCAATPGRCGAPHYCVKFPGVPRLPAHCLYGRAFRSTLDKYPES